ncbi:hypothetical protein FQA39_LY13397 [Lamprigera yunnana]|nr:hypothetical protein FQA39_LY13397 [Lamprigera yunnana]
MWKPWQVGSKILTFEMIEQKKVLRIEDMFGTEVHLGWESLSEVWSLDLILSRNLDGEAGQLGGGLGTSRVELISFGSKYSFSSEFDMSGNYLSCALLNVIVGPDNFNDLNLKDFL